MLRGTAAAIVVATGLAASAVGATALRGRNAAKHAESTAAANSSGASAAPVTTVTTDSGRSSAQQAGAPGGTALPSVPVARTTPPAAPPSVPFSPILPAGTSPLADGVTAFRSDSVVTVSFDLPMQRTRLPEKFEHFVRATLPAVYGPGIDSILAKVAVGGLASQGNLLTALPSAGVRIPVTAAWELRVFPETRKGLDGPLVVRYRTMVCGTRDSACGAR